MQKKKLPYKFTQNTVLKKYSNYVFSKIFKKWAKFVKIKESLSDDNSF